MRTQELSNTLRLWLRFRESTTVDLTARVIRGSLRLEKKLIYLIYTAYIYKLFITISYVILLGVSHNMKVITLLGRGLHSMSVFLVKNIIRQNAFCLKIRCLYK